MVRHTASLKKDKLLGTTSPSGRSKQRRYNTLVADASWRCLSSVVIRLSHGQSSGFASRVHTCRNNIDLKIMLAGCFISLDSIDILFRKCQRDQDWAINKSQTKRLSLPVRLDTMTNNWGKLVTHQMHPSSWRSTLQVNLASEHPKKIWEASSATPYNM
jgi:hypothetical protein